ncbi:MAG: hypothetical protein AAF518_08460 [Spirochaetota bacterium]
MQAIFVENSKVPIVCSYLFPGNWLALALGKERFQIYAITLWPFVFCRSRLDQVSKQHESIHILQAGELLVFGFYLVYLWDWLHAIVKYSHKEKRQGQDLFTFAYYRIRAEQEAYSHEKTPIYLQKRQKWSWLRKYTV